MIRPPSKYCHADLVAFALSIADDVEGAEPNSYTEVIKSIESPKWQLAMQEEIEFPEKNKTWELVKVSLEQRIVRCKWVFKKKEPRSRSC